ncbi:hypothetical protein [Mycobacterium sp. Marseille-P9652]|uniref:hypothetical protein n=1 Tax=Mycobacterium sp. Marseille-P9652 TaxID=2654950 RepID=UPI001E2CE635|nr:hypothetical protein [Mycobacterium sp. Marseille-P9652]
MNWMTLIGNALVPLASVISSASVAIWTKRIDARNKEQDRLHERVLDFEKRAADDKKAVLKSLISATIYVKRAAQYQGTGTAEELASQRRAEALRELYDFRMRLGLDDGVAELMVYAAPPVRDLVSLLLDEWDRQFREHGYSLTQLDSCKRELAQTTACPPPREDTTVYYEGELKWSELRKIETGWLERLGRESDLDVDALVDLCDRTLEAAHKDLRGGYGIDF